MDYVSGQVNPGLVHPMPEIYYPVNGPQWASIGKASTPVLNFAGALTEYPTGNTPAQGWTDLFQASGQTSLPWSSNI